MIIAVILFSLVWSKFQVQPDGLNDFTAIGIDPKGRILYGIVELIAVLLLLIPRTTGWGAILLIFTMTSIIFSYFSSHEGGTINGVTSIFYKSIIVWAGSVILFIKYRGQVLRMVNRLLNRI